MDPRMDPSKRYTYTSQPAPAARDWATWFWGAKKEDSAPPRPLEAAKASTPPRPLATKFGLTPDQCAGLDSSQFSIFFIDGTFDDYKFGSPRTQAFVPVLPRSVCYAFLKWLQLDPYYDFDKIEAWEQAPGKLLFVKTPEFGAKFNFPTFDEWARTISADEAQSVTFDVYAKTMFNAVKKLYPNFQFMSLAEYLGPLSGADRQEAVLSYIMDLRRAVEYRINQDRAHYTR